MRNENNTVKHYLKGAQIKYYHLASTKYEKIAQELRITLLTCFVFIK